MKSDRGSSVLLAIALILITGLLIGAFHTSNNSQVLQSSESFATPSESFELQGGFWRIDHTFRPVLILTNVLQTNSLSATPVLYAADGTEFRLSQVKLGPAGVANVDILQAIQSAPADIRAHFSQYGSVSVRYAWHWPGAIGAAVQNRDIQRSLNYNFDLHAAMMTPTVDAKTVQEGLWWKEDEGITGFVSLMNGSKRSVDVDVRVLTNSGETEEIRQIRLGPRQTQSVQILRNARSISGGLRVTYSADVKEVVIAAGLENAHEGYSARIPFNVLQKTEDSSAVTLSSTGFMLGTPDPSMNFPSGTIFGGYLAIRNVSQQKLDVSQVLHYMNGSDVNTTSLRTLTLGPGESRFLNESEFAAETGLTTFSGIANLVFSYRGGPNDLIVADGSIDQKRSFVSEILTRAVGNSQAIGLKDWGVSNGNNTMITVLNLSESDQNFLVTFFYENGSYALPVPLKSHGSTMLNVSELISAQQADAAGNKIPSDTQHGTAVLSGASGYPEMINVGVSVGVFNVATATCGNKCPTCFGYSDFKVLQNNPNAAVGGTATFKAQAFGQNGIWQDVTNASNPSGSAIVVWSSSNSSIASSQGNGNFKGVKPGGFDAQANATLLDLNADCPEGQNQPCPNSPYFDQAGGAIMPRIDSITPPRGAAGSTVSVTLAGAGLSGGSVSAGSGITATVNSGTDTQLQASFVVSTSAVPGNHSVTVTAGGQSSTPVTFYVQIPTSLSIVTGTDSTTPESSCTYMDVHGNPQTGCGMVRSFMYQVNDQEVPPQPIQAALPVWDVITTTTPNNLMITGYLTTCTPANTGPCGIFTSNTGQFEEHSLSVCSGVCRANNVCKTGGPTNATQAIHLGASVIAQNDSYFCDHVTVNGQ